MKYTQLLILAIATAHVSAADWPQFHGPNRDNISTDKGLLKAWSEGGASRIWEAAGIGEGYSSVADPASYSRELCRSDDRIKKVLKEGGMPTHSKMSD